MVQAEALSPERRARILDGASAVFAAHGYEGASMAGIATQAGVSKGTLYNYFPSKAMLFAAYVGEECSRHLIHVFDEAHHDGVPAATALRSVGRRMLEIMISPVGQTIYRMVVSEAAKFPELAQTFFDAGPARAIGGLAEWLAEQTRRGQLRVSDPEFAAEQFFSLCQTRVVLRQKLGLLVTPTAAEIERVVNAAVEMFLLRYARGHLSGAQDGRSTCGSPAG